jgi:large subunit ribosomal protein L13
MIIDATNLIIGRLATVVAKKALLGEKIHIVNAEKAVITGKKELVLSRYRQKKDRGAPRKGPYLSRYADRILRKTIRGMLPYKLPRGKEAYSHVMCYLGVPEEFKDKKAETVQGANVSKVPNLNYMTLGDVSKLL